MYGMYGKMGSGVSPQNTVHYRTYRTPARTFPAPAGGGKCPLEGVQRERLAHDFGTKSSVLYPSRRGTGEITDWPQPVRDFDRTEKEEREVSVSTPHGRTFSESRGGYSPLPRPQNTTEEEQRWLMPFYDLPSTRAARPRR